MLLQPVIHGRGRDPEAAGADLTLPGRQGPLHSVEMGKCCELLSDHTGHGGSVCRPSGAGTIPQIWQWHRGPEPSQMPPSTARKPGKVTQGWGQLAASFGPGPGSLGSPMETGEGLTSTPGSPSPSPPSLLLRVESQGSKPWGEKGECF